MKYVSKMDQGVPMYDLGHVPPTDFNRPKIGDEVGLGDLYLQYERETEMVTKGVEQWRANLNKLHEKGMEDKSVPGQRFIHKVMSRFAPEVEKLQARALEGLATDESEENLVPLRCLDADVLAFLTVMHVMALRHGSLQRPKSNDKDPTKGMANRSVRDLLFEVAAQIVRERQFDVWARKERVRLGIGNEPIPRCLQRPLRDVAGEVEQWRQEKVTRPRDTGRLAKIRKATDALKDVDPREVSEERGVHRAARELLALLVSTCPDYFESNKVCYHQDFTFRVSKGKLPIGGHPEEQVYLTPKAVEELEDPGEDLARPILMPMICPPRPWTWTKDPDRSGYVGGYRRLDDLRLLSNRSYRKHTRALQDPVSQKTIDAANAVQATAWRINRRIADILRQVAESKHREKLGLGPIKQVKVPRRCSYKAWNAKSDDEQARYEFRLRKKCKRYAQHEITWRLLNAIEQDEKRKAIWFPVYLDFRGRMYYYPQYLDPQGYDPVRAVLYFAEGKPVGDSGEEMLLRHLLSTYGGQEARDYMTNPSGWVKYNRQQLSRLAENPLEEIAFWKNASDPWQFLATCFEWSEMHRKGNKFESHLPVAMDGRCNGLQHLAAMAKDPLLGKQVNLTGDGSQGDVYQSTADELIKLLASYTSCEAKARAKALLDRKGLINRDTVKKPVMTIPYGVSQTGMRDQLLENEAFFQTDGSPYRDARYVAGKIRQIIRKGVPASAIKVQDWLSEVAGILAPTPKPDEKDNQPEQKPLLWKNPADMAIRMAYYMPSKLKPVRIRACYRPVSTNLRVEPDEDEMKSSKGQKGEIDVWKQKRSAAACLVHSFDAAHLALTVNACHDVGIRSFSVVHDSFATHACHAHRMGVLLREQFVEMYSKDQLEELAKQWRSQAQELGREIPDPPARGELKIEDVCDSKYFFW